MAFVCGMFHNLTNGLGASDPGRALLSPPPLEHKRDNPDSTTDFSPRVLAANVVLSLPPLPVSLSIVILGLKIESRPET